MKKLTALMLVLVMSLSLLAGCGGKGPEVSGTEATKVDTSALEILNTVWEGYLTNVPEDMQFPAGGGEPETMNMEGPGELNVTNSENLSFQLNLAADLHSQITEAASLMHMMNANTFTAGVFKLAAGTDAAAFVSTQAEALKGTQWICGFPEQMMIATLYGEYVVMAYGNGEIMDLFRTEFTNAYAEAEILVDEAL